MLSTAELPVPSERLAADRRTSARLAGPLDAWRVGDLETPARIYNIGLGGCFVNAMHDQDLGVRMVLKVQLPGGQWVELKAETLYTRPDSGFAVRFVDMDPDTCERLERALLAPAAAPRPLF